LTLPKSFKSVVSNADDLDAASYRLHEIKNVLEKENIHEINETRLNHFSVLTYVICIVGFMWICYYLYKKCFPKCLLLPLFNCCSKNLELKVEESLKQVQTMSRPIVVKQYQYGASIEDIHSTKSEPSVPLLDSSSKSKVDPDKIEHIDKELKDIKEISKDTYRYLRPRNKRV
jgi:short subunit fatty acids transporter